MLAIRIKHFFTLILFFHISVLIANNEDLTVHIAINNDLPPYEYQTKQNSFEGFNIDLCGVLLENLNQKIIFENIDQISQSEIDIIPFATEFQEIKGYTFIPTGVRIDYVVYLRQGTDIGSINDLHKKRTIVVKNDPCFEQLYQNKTQHIYTVKTYQKALEILNSGVNDCAVIPFYIAQEIIKSNGYKDLTYITTPYLSLEMGLWIKSSRKDLIQEIDKQLNTISKQGNLNNLLNAWFKDETANAKSNLTIFSILIIAFLVIVIIFLLLLIKTFQIDIKYSTKQVIQLPANHKNNPLTINLDNELLQKLITLAPAPLFINDNEGNIVLSSKEFIQEFPASTQNMNHLTVKNTLGDELNIELKKWEHKLSIQQEELIIQLITINNEHKWLLKLPICISNETTPFYFNIISPPLLTGANTLKRMTPEERLASIINSLPDMIFFKNIDGQYLGVNKAFENFTGMKESEIIGKTDFELFPEEKAKRYIKSDQTVFKEQATYKDETWDIASNNESMFLNNIKIPILDKLHRVYGLVGISYDITQRYHTEQALANAKEKAEESDRIKSSFLANMSQEIRTPLNSIIGFTDLLADPDLTYDQRIEIIDLIQTNGHNLIDVIDDIIDISKIDGGQIKIKYSDFDINLVIKDSLSHINAKKMQMNKEHMNVSFSIGSMEDEFFVHSDLFRLKQIFKNLLNYGLRYFTTDNLNFGYIIYQDRIIAFIKDENSPLSVNKISEVIQANTTTIDLSEIEESSGISFMIANNLVKMIGGSLLFDTVLDQYSAFYFSIPYVKAEMKERPAPKTALPSVPNWKGKTLLVAEDEETNFILINSLLQKTEATVIRASNGKEAIELFKENQNTINLILMDIRMPKINGVEASRKIIEMDSKVKIIAQTAYVMAEDKDLYFKIGMKEVLSKPIDPTELYYTIGRHLKE